MYKKILCYIDSIQNGIGGAERVMSNLCNDFVNRNKKVILVNDVRNAIDDEYYLNSEVERRYTNYEDGNFIVKNIKRILNLRKIVKEENPDIILSFMAPPCIRILLATLFLKNKVVVSVRNDPSKEYGTGLKKLLTKLIFKRANGIVFQTVDASKYFGKHINQKSEIIFNPVDESFFNQKHLKEDNSIIMVGRLEEQKNISLALRAFKNVTKNNPDYYLKLVGDGSLKDDIKKQIKELNIEDKVIFTGLISNVKEELARSSIFLMTSNYEGLPNSLMEAMAVGMPVISSDCPVGGPRSLILNDSQGLLFKNNNVNDLTEKLQLCLSNKDLRNSLRTESKKRAYDFKPEKVFEKWDSFLNKIYFD